MGYMYRYNPALRHVLARVRSQASARSGYERTAPKSALHAEERKSPEQIMARGGAMSPTRPFTSCPAALHIDMDEGEILECNINSESDTKPVRDMWMLSDYLVPILRKDEIEAGAEALLENYYPEALGDLKAHDAFVLAESYMAIGMPPRNRIYSNCLYDTPRGRAPNAGREKTRAPGAGSDQKWSVIYKGFLTNTLSSVSRLPFTTTSRRSSASASGHASVLPDGIDGETPGDDRRKNWLFCNTTNGAQASASVYSIVETAKA